MNAAGAPSVLAPAGLEAAALAEVTWVLIIGAALLFTGTLALLALALRARSRRERPSRWWVLGGGVALPVSVLGALLLYSTARTAGLELGLANPPLVVAVTGRLWWWELSYRDPASGRSVQSANELRIPVGRPVQLGLRSDDVIHSLWVPELGGKMDLVPGRTNRLVITATRPGLYRGQCAEFCGEQHAKMALHVRAMPAPEFDRWLAAQAAGPAPGDTRAGDDTPGRRAFVAHGCAACHAVEATPGGPGSGPNLGPNLAQLADRTHLGAGLLPNDAVALRRWITDVQAIKPGARMPSYAQLDAATLDALVAYLGTLR